MIFPKKNEPQHELTVIYFLITFRRVWSVRFNFFHDQLVLSSSSDCKVLLTCTSSVSSEASNEHTDKENL